MCPTTPGRPTDAASRKCDHHIAVGKLRFAAGEATKQLSLSIVDDVYVEIPESLALTLSNPLGAALGQNQRVPVAILDNDIPGTSNPIDNTSFFVRQLYVDLLSREPDPSGWLGWTARIDQCAQPGQPPPPRNRVTVAGDGFLRSGEFFDRQFFVERDFRACGGKRQVLARSAGSVGLLWILHEESRRSVLQLLAAFGQWRDHARWPG